MLVAAFSRLQDQGAGGQRRGGGMGRERSGFRASGFSGSMTGGLPDRFQRRSGFRQQQNPNMQALGSISRPGGSSSGYGRPGDRRGRDL